VATEFQSGETNMFSTILVPLDFSPHSDKALQTAVQLGKQLRPEIHLVLAFGRPIPPAVPHEVLIPNDYWGTDEAGAKALLERRFTAVTEAGLGGGVHLIQGHPDRVIVDLAASLPADLIVMGSRGRTGLSHVFIGSTAERTMRLASCPVLIVKAAQEDKSWEGHSLVERSPR